MPLVETEFTEITPKRAIDSIVNDLFHDLHGKHEFLDKKIEKAYQAFHGRPFPKKALPKRVTPLALMGPPGHGKTTAFKVAARRFCELTGMKFVLNPTDDYVPTNNDFLFISHELSGQTSAVDFGGIPSKTVEELEDGTQIEFMTKLVNKRLALLRRAGAGILLLDDFPNASPAVQNVLLSILDERRFQGLSLGNVYPCVTGNLGAKDYTTVSPVSSAIVSRTMMRYVEDTVQDYIGRATQLYNDSMGDAGVSGFLRAKGAKLFAQLPSSRNAPFPCPRTWDHLVWYVRDWQYLNQEMLADPSKVNEAIGELQDMAAGHVGRVVAKEMAAYYQSQALGAAPIAKELMDTGTLSEKAEKRFKDMYEGGHSAQAQEFGYQFAVPLIDHAVNLIAEDPDVNMEPAMERLAEGLFRLSNPLVSMATNYLESRLAHRVNTLSEEVSNGAETSRRLTEDAMTMITKHMAMHPNSDGKIRSVYNVLGKNTLHDVSYGA